MGLFDNLGDLTDKAMLVTKVKDAINDSEYDVEDLEVKVSGSKVSIFGTVDSEKAKNKISKIAYDVNGVEDVENHLDVSEGDSDDDEYEDEEYDEDSEDDSEEIWYEVKHGDTLWGIAQHFYGDGSKYMIIHKANPDVVNKDPNVIYPGWVLYIPQI